MVQIGKFQTLPVSRLVPFGAYLATDTPGEEILLPNNQLPPDVKVGDALEVFIYRDSEDRLIATQKKPFAQVGDIAALKDGSGRVFGLGAGKGFIPAVS